MYITTQQVAKQLTADSSNVQEIVQTLSIIKSLVAKHGSAMFTETMRQALSGEYGLIDMLHLLKELEYTSVTQIKALLAVIKQESDDYVREVTIKAPQPIQSSLHDVVQKQFTHVQIDNQKETHQVAIKGEGWSYERNAYKDVDKLLR